MVKKFDFVYVINVYKFKCFVYSIFVLLIHWVMPKFFLILRRFSKYSEKWKFNNFEKKKQNKKKTR